MGTVWVRELIENAEIEELNQRLMKLTVRIETAQSSILTGEDWKTETGSLVEELTKELTNIKKDFIDAKAKSNGWSICGQIAKLLEDVERDTGMLTQFMLGVSGAANITFPTSSEDETLVAECDAVSKFLKNPEFRVKLLTSREFRIFINCLLLAGKIGIGVYKFLKEKKSAEKKRTEEKNPEEKKWGDISFFIFIFYETFMRKEEL
ncbi:Histone H2B [Corchorus capsularis]|uniref:Histone H2B n=1 Tax=Corchorus capsularis TaxID=210143 RepID=A0A1R3GH64_COCAP|nr:Histone H2B [Corchorus capsularis]